jgi:signal transduction histidine kinase
MQRPDNIDSRLIHRGYTIAALATGLVVVSYRWPAPPQLTVDRIAISSLWSLILIGAGNAIWISGAVAWGFSRIEHAAARLKVLRSFAVVLIVLGVTYWAPAFPILRVLLPTYAAWGPIIAGLSLLWLSLDLRGSMARQPASLRVTYRERKGLSLKVQYEEQIREAARQEERARLARDLHDAVKQQLFAIQAAAATVEARFGTDAAGARQALEQVRTSSREALTEMEVMLDQLQAVPLSTPGLIDALKRLCDATRFRTGANVTFEAGDLPEDAAFAPGAHQAMLRFAQEALANVARHARAANVRVRFGESLEWVPVGARERRFILSVADDGQGFETGAAPASGMGLRNMSARAAEAGGTFEVSSARGTGTTATLTIISTVESPRWYLMAAALSLAAVVFMLATGGLSSRNPGRFVWLVLAIGSAVRFAARAPRRVVARRDPAGPADSRRHRRYRNHTPRAGDRPFGEGGRSDGLHG